MHTLAGAEKPGDSSGKPNPAVTVLSQESRITKDAIATAHSQQDTRSQHPRFLNAFV